MLKKGTRQLTKNLRRPMALSWFLGLALQFAPAAEGKDDILGRWAVDVETPNGSLRLDLDLTAGESGLTGILFFFQGTFPLSNLRFQNSTLSAEVRVGESTFRATGGLSGGKFAGEWSVRGKDIRGIWTAERKTSAVRGAVADDIVGYWPVMLDLPNGVLNLALELKQTGGTIWGTLGGDAGTLPLQSVLLDQDRLRFEVQFAGETYRFECTLKNHKLSGRWFASGAWKSSGKTSAETKPNPH